MANGNFDKKRILTYEDSMPSIVDNNCILLMISPKVHGKELPAIDWARGEPNNAKESEHCLTFWTPER